MNGIEQFFFARFYLYDKSFHKLIISFVHLVAIIGTFLLLLLLLFPNFYNIDQLYIIKC